MAVKRFPLVCTQCSKEFFSPGGYQYHVSNVCGDQGGAAAAGAHAGGPGLGGGVGVGVGDRLSSDQGGGGGGGSSYQPAQRNKRKHSATGGHFSEKTILHQQQGLAQGPGLGQGQSSELSGRGRKTELFAIRSAFQAAAAGKSIRHLHNDAIFTDENDDDEHDDDDNGGHCFDNDGSNVEHAEYLRCKQQWLSTPSALFAAQVVSLLSIQSPAQAIVQPHPSSSPNPSPSSSPSPYRNANPTSTRTLTCIINVYHLFYYRLLAVLSTSNARSLSTSCQITPPPRSSLDCSWRVTWRPRQGLGMTGPSPRSLSRSGCSPHKG